VGTFAKLSQNRKDLRKILGLKKEREREDIT